MSELRGPGASERQREHFSPVGMTFFPSLKLFILGDESNFGCTVDNTMVCRTVLRATVWVAVLGAVARANPDPPNPKHLIETFVVDLDTPPEERYATAIQSLPLLCNHHRNLSPSPPLPAAWCNDSPVPVARLLARSTPPAHDRRWTGLIKEKHVALVALLDIIRPVFKLFAPVASRELVEATIRGMPDEYVREMQGIANVASEFANVTLDDVVMANLFYEITGIANTPLFSGDPRSCTSMVAQRSNGTVYLARNQDYPPPFTLVMVHAVFTKVRCGHVFSAEINCWVLSDSPTRALLCSFD